MNIAPKIFNIFNNIDDTKISKLNNNIKQKFVSLILNFHTNKFEYKFLVKIFKVLYKNGLITNKNYNYLIKHYKIRVKISKHLFFIIIISRILISKFKNSRNIDLIELYYLNLYLLNCYQTNKDLINHNIVLTCLIFISSLNQPNKHIINSFLNIDDIILFKDIDNYSEIVTMCPIIYNISKDKIIEFLILVNSVLINDLHLCKSDTNYLKYIEKYIDYTITPNNEQQFTYLKTYKSHLVFEYLLEHDNNIVNYQRISNSEIILYYPELNINISIDSNEEYNVDEKFENVYKNKNGIQVISNKGNTFDYIIEIDYGDQIKTISQEINLQNVLLFINNNIQTL